MGKNKNGNKLKARILESDPKAGVRLNNLHLFDADVHSIIATEVTSRYDLNFDINTFDSCMNYGFENSPSEFFDELDRIQLGDMNIEGDDLMFLTDEDDDGVFESFIDDYYYDDYSLDDVTVEDCDFAEDMATECQKFSVIANYDEEELRAFEADEVSDNEAYAILLEEDDDDDMDDVFDEVEGDDDDDIDDSELSDEEFLSDEIMLDPQFDDEF